MGYSETAKQFNDIRLMARQLYAEGYKTHNEIVESSSKKSHATENDIKRVESLFKEFSEVKKNKKEKISYVSIDARATPTNPLYKLFRSAKFPDATANIYFALFDILSNGEPLSSREIAEDDEYASFFQKEKKKTKAKT
ncbi:MAG: hypothetical protein MJ052_06145, partial [Sphaerochaetaceae bacterium]|nr:hypothetical protein [Sphaerochaetaceae bacterium]